MNPAHIDAAREAHQAHAARQFAQLKALLGVIGAAVLIALGLRSFAYEPFNIPSESMLPTLYVGDYLFVAKFPYGYGRFTLPLGLPLIDGRVFNAMPRRGDVAVFKSPADNRTDFIKRVIGLPGDRVRMTGGRVEINGRIVPKRRGEDFLIPPPDGGNCASIPGRAAALERDGTGHAVCRFAQFVETIDGHGYRVLDQIDGDVRDDTPVVTVPAGSYFVLGDNRDDSADSRLTVAEGGVGMIPAANLIGRADRLFFSVDGTARIGNPASWFSSVRARRIGVSL